MHRKCTSEFLNKYRKQILTRDQYASKADYGKLLIIAGSEGMAGAAFLSGLAAFRSGIGMVRFYGPECNRVPLQTLLPEAMYTVDRFYTEEVSDTAEPEREFCDAEHLDRALAWADAVICGPGLSRGIYAKTIVRQLFRRDLSEKDLILLDADALNVISELKLNISELSVKRKAEGKPGNVVITPHVGEMSRLVGKDIGEVRMKAEAIAKAFAKENCCTVVLKDSTSYVAVPSGRAVYRNDSGTGALAKAGSGDVLCGVIAGTAEVIGRDAVHGAILGCYLHGRAGEAAALYHGEHSILARDVADAVGAVIGIYCYKYDRILKDIEDISGDSDEGMGFDGDFFEDLEYIPEEWTDMTEKDLPKPVHFRGKKEK